MFLFSIVKRIVIICISAVVLLYDSIRRQALVLLGRKPAARCVVLYYHDIPEKQQGRFARQMDLLLKFSQPFLCSAIPTLEEGKRYAGITFDDGFISFKELALPELERRRLPSTVFIPTQFLGIAPGWLAGSSKRLMTPDVIREIAKNTLVTIGSHGVSHRPFTRILPNEAKNEFIESKQVLESILGEKVTLFSFPHGAYSEEHLQMAREAGYVRIFSIQPACAFGTPDEYSTGRVKVEPSDWPLEFALKITGAYRWLPYALLLKKSLRATFS